MSKSKKHRAFIHREVFANGIGDIAIVRRKDEIISELGLFLVDTHCCGVKNVRYAMLSELKLDSILREVFGNPADHEVAPGEACHLVESAVAYAGRYGLPPHRDYRKARRVFGGLPPLPPKAPWQFGENGKPLYVQGPHDSPAFIEHVVRNLIAHAGDKFDYIIEMGAIERLVSRGIELPQAHSLIEPQGYYGY